LTVKSNKKDVYSEIARFNSYAFFFTYIEYINFNSDLKHVMCLNYNRI